MPVAATPAAAGVPTAEGDAALSGVAPDLAASTSDFTTRPLGPVPEMAATSMPASLARRRANGDANTLSPADFVGAGAAFAPGNGAGAASVLVASALAGSAVLAGGAALAASSFGASAFGASALGAAVISSALSPSCSNTAITALTFTLSVPSATRILPILPSSTASTSIVALSVSISAITSPEETVSPSLTCHLASLPSSIVGESAGMVISIGIPDLLTNGR